MCRQSPAIVEACQAQSRKGFDRKKPAHRPLLEHLPRECVAYRSPSTCRCCGGILHKLGEDVTETLDLVRRQWMVIQHEREINDLMPTQRMAVRNERSRPLIIALGAWLREQRAKLFGQKRTAKVIAYVGLRPNIQAQSAVFEVRQCL